MKKYLKIKRNSLALLLVVAFFSSCQENEIKSPWINPDLGKTQTVEVVRPQHNSFESKMEVTGTAMPNKMTTIYAMEEGFVKEIRKDIGSYVKKGEIIAVLNNPELIRKQQKYTAQLESKKSIYDRLNSVYKNTPSIIPVKEVEDAQAEYLMVKADLDAINDRIYHLKITAPFSGTITKRYVDNGMLLQSGLKVNNPSGVVDIQQTNPIRLTAPIPEADAVNLKVGSKAKIVFPEMSGGTIAAEVSRTSGSLDPSSKTMQIEFDLDNADGKILTGMYAKVSMELSGKENALSLPQTAYLMLGDVPCVYAVVDGKVQKIEIRKGLSNKDFFEVLNDDITPESWIITNGKSLVKPGQKVDAKLKE